MTLIRRTNPLGELVSLRQAMEPLSADSSTRAHGTSRAAEKFRNAEDTRAREMSVATRKTAMVQPLVDSEQDS